MKMTKIKLGGKALENLPKTSHTYLLSLYYKHSPRTSLESRQSIKIVTFGAGGQRAGLWGREPGLPL